MYCEIGIKNAAALVRSPLPAAIILQAFPNLHLVFRAVATLILNLKHC